MNINHRESCGRCHSSPCACAITTHEMARSAVLSVARTYPCSRVILDKYIDQQEASESAPSDTVSRAEHEARIEEESTRAAEWMDTADKRLRQLTSLQAEHERALTTERARAEEAHDALRSERDHYVHEASRLGRELAAANARAGRLEARERVLRDFSEHMKGYLLVEDEEDRETALGAARACLSQYERLLSTAPQASTEQAEHGDARLFRQRLSRLLAEPTPIKGHSLYTAVLGLVYLGSGEGAEDEEALERAFARQSRGEGGEAIADDSAAQEEFASELLEHLTSLASTEQASPSPAVGEAFPPRPPGACDCHRCWKQPAFGSYMVVCTKCGNKRCPKAEWHGFLCTGSNEPSQVGAPEEPAQPAPSIEAGRVQTSLFRQVAEASVQSAPGGTERLVPKVGERVRNKLSGLRGEVTERREGGLVRLRYDNEERAYICAAEVLEPCPAPAEPSGTERHHELNEATWCVRCGRFDPSGECSGQPAPGGTERWAKEVVPTKTCDNCGAVDEMCGKIGCLSDVEKAEPTPAEPQGRPEQAGDRRRLWSQFIDAFEAGEHAWVQKKHDDAVSRLFTAVAHLARWCEAGELERKAGK